MQYKWSAKGKVDGILYFFMNELKYGKTEIFPKEPYYY